MGSYLRSSNTVRYALTDHLGNTRVTFTANEEGIILVQEAHDYYPHGGLLPGRQLNGTASSLRSASYPPSGSCARSL